MASEINQLTTNGAPSNEKSNEGEENHQEGVEKRPIEGKDGDQPQKKVKVEDAAEPAAQVRQKPYGRSTPDLLCDVCFTEESETDKDGFLPEGDYPFISCRTCNLVGHTACFAPESDVDQDGFFTCNACEALKKHSTPKPYNKRVRESISPKPLTSDIEAVDDGRVYPAPKKKGDIDIYCALCLRRDVIGGMKPTFGSAWCHLACSMSSPEIYSKGNRLTGIQHAIQKSREKINKAMNKITKVESILCECCQRPGGMLIQCAFVDDDNNKTCNIFQHPLCAELSDRERDIESSEFGDLVYYKCALHSFGEDARCGICKFGSRQNAMLECDKCSNGYHMDCLPIPLKEVPEDDWFCPKCKPENHIVSSPIGEKISTKIDKDIPPMVGESVQDTTKEVETPKPTEGESKSEVAEPSGVVNESQGSAIEVTHEKLDTELPTESDNKTSEVGEEKTKKTDVKENVETTSVTKNPDPISVEEDLSSTAPDGRADTEQKPETPGPIVLLKKNQTADSFPVGDPSLDYSLVESSEAKTKTT